MSAVEAFIKSSIAAKYPDHKLVGPWRSLYQEALQDAAMIAQVG